MIKTADLGVMDYEEAFEIQKKINRQLQMNREIPGYLFFVEHPPVFTLGRNRKEEDFLFSVDYVKNQGFQVFESNRGGNVTYHGPGQIVGYLLVNMEHFKKDVQWFVWQMEEWIMETLKHVNMKSNRKEKYRGIWIEDEKICALGVAIKRWATMHGFALNHTTNLDHFRYINPCGITEYGITSIEKQGVDYQREDMIQFLKKNFEGMYMTELESITMEEVKWIASKTEA
ncbi:lipoyl(octanoyl) transferase LipB [Tindallia californiensis]|uniref:Octanoyltransferase n=1 Tax=Tindallia californiensis TaxID=159292 RepID=A0A1H3L4S1_9FIRM|nr:lipoyl(octanoyl) transferase LipB [Tindallia californiensis]SDY58948.1 lipoyl(octanoyl) transferase [Tindallia californiensis]